MGRYYRNNVLGANDNNTTDVLAVTNSCNSCNHFNNNSCNNNCNRNEDMLDNLCNFLGCNCNCQFDTRSSRGLEEVNGILEEVGEDFITLRSTSNGRRTICNTDNLQFVTIL
ncbi:MAG: hypothetical protein IJ217_05720 [Clostridia bacterium]|nr:hypothetical protein [Clostridia bacterium]